MQNNSHDDIEKLIRNMLQHGTISVILHEEDCWLFCKTRSKAKPILWPFYRIPWSRLACNRHDQKDITYSDYFSLHLLWCNASHFLLLRTTVKEMFLTLFTCVWVSMITNSCQQIWTKFSGSTDYWPPTNQLHFEHPNRGKESHTRVKFWTPTYAHNNWSRTS